MGAALIILVVALNAWIKNRQKKAELKKLS
jgi:uncharacterized protein YjiS (DUF1127 family)